MNIMGLQLLRYNLNRMTEQAAPDIEATGEDITALSEELLDSLRLLNYEKEYVQKGGKTVTASTFAYQTNPTEQFGGFKSLVKFLLQLNDVAASDFSKYDDPMTVSTNIINECKKLQIPTDFPPLKLKAGSGEQVLVILTLMATKALKKKNFTFKKPKYEDPAKEEAQADEEGNNKGQENEQLIDQAEMAEEDELDEKENVGIATVDEERQIIHSAVNENDWKLQCQRVANKLKVQSKADTKEWRSHIDTTKTCTDLVKKNFPSARGVLEKINDDLSRTLETISKSQRMINSNMSEVGEVYKSQSSDLKKLSAHYNNLSAGLKEMNENYRVVSEKLEQMQQKTNEHSGTMTDNSPVLKIKEALIKIISDIKAMDVTIGVLGHTILQYKTKERNQDKKALARHMDAEDLYDLQ